jgi:hypothetical protein
VYPAVRTGAERRCAYCCDDWHRSTVNPLIVLANSSGGSVSFEPHRFRKCNGIGGHNTTIRVVKADVKGFRAGLVGDTETASNSRSRIEHPRTAFGAEVLPVVPCVNSVRNCRNGKHHRARSDDEIEPSLLAAYVHLCY